MYFHFVELPEERSQGAINHRAGAAMDFDMEQARAWIGTEVRFRDEPILQQVPGGGVVDGRGAHP